MWRGSWTRSGSWTFCSLCLKAQAGPPSVMHLSSEGGADEEREAGPPDGRTFSGTDTTLFLPEQEIP